MKEIVIFVEGGGDANSKARLREGFMRLLNAPRLEAVRLGVRFRVIPSGSRSDTFKDFRRAHEAKSEGQLILMLVDSEEPLQGTPREHLVALDRWDLSNISDDQLHLMVHTMEAWFLTDPELLEAYYGQNFARNALPRNPKVEAIPKADVMSGLEQSTRKTQKGAYNKTRHGPEILTRLSTARLRDGAPHFDRLFQTLLRHLAS